MLKLLQISKHFLFHQIQGQKQVSDQILQKLKDENIVLENPIITQLLTCLNQLQLLLSIQKNECLKIIYKQDNTIKFVVKIEWISNLIQDENEINLIEEKLQFLENIEIQTQTSGTKQMKLNINKTITDKIHQLIIFPSLDELYVMYLKNQEITIQLLIKLFCLVSIIQEEFNKILYSLIQNQIQEKEISIKQRIILTNLDIIYQTPPFIKPDLEVKNINHIQQQNKYLIYQQHENMIITKAFELLDNQMYGKRKKSFEKDKESAYQNMTQRIFPEIPMDIFLLGPQAILSKVAPPSQSPVLTHVSTFPQPNSLCFSPTNSDSHSFTSQQNKGFNYTFGHLHSQFIDQNQYAQISQQNIDLQERYRRMIQNIEQDQRHSRSKSNSQKTKMTNMNDIFKYICPDNINLASDKNEKKQSNNMQQQNQDIKR